MRAKKKGREKKSHILSLQGAYGPMREAGWGCAQRGTNAGSGNPKNRRSACCVSVRIEGTAHT